MGQKQMRGQKQMLGQMASLSPHRSSSSSSLGIQQLNDVLELLKKCGFSKTRWFELGLALGLSKNTLETIKADHPQNTRQCLIECLSKWLERADNVDSKGGATWDSLSDALRSMDEIAVADKLDQEKRQVLALSIFDKHHSHLSESLSDPVSVARWLNAERVISTEVIGADSLDKHALLTVLREAIKTNHTFLQKFAIVLCKVTGNVWLGEEILRDYGTHFPSDDKLTSTKIKAEIEIPVYQSMSKEFTSIRTSLGSMIYDVCEAIEKAQPDIEKMKKLIGSCNHNLKPKLAECHNISDVLSVAEEECSLTDVNLLKTVVEKFNVKEAEEYIEKYKALLKEFLENTPLAHSLKEKFDAVKTHPLLKCETVTYIFDWRPDQKKLSEIREILSELSGKFVRIRYIDEGNSIVVTCSFPYSLLGVLIARVMENLQLLKDKGLIKLTIGYWTVWEKEKTSQKEIELPQEQDVLPTIKSADQDEHVKLLELKDTIHQLMDTLTTQEKLCTEKLSELKQEIEPASVAVLEEEIKALTVQIEEQKMTNENLTKIMENSQQEIIKDKISAEAALREQELLDSHSKALEEKDETIKSLGVQFDYLIPQSASESHPGMAVCSPSSFEASLDINDLENVLQLLKKCDFSDSKWMELGPKLGLKKKTTLNTIEANYPKDVSCCLIECLSKWLERADDVDSKGGATWDSLSNALRSMNEHAVADKLDQEKSQVLALSIFDKHHSLLSESLSDPVSVARWLNAERVISSQVVISVEAENRSTLNQCQILLSALREAIQANHTSLQSFAIVLLKVTGNVQLGQVILSNYGEYFPSNDETTLVKFEEDVCTSTHQTVTVEIPIHKNRSDDFKSLRTSLGRMMYNVCKAIEEAGPELEDLKELVGSCNSDLKPKLAECFKVSDILSLVKEECSLTHFTLLETLVKEFNVKKAEKYIEEYRGILKEFLDNNPIAHCLKEKFDAAKTPPPLNCETITCVFDWRPDERMLKDITDILSDSSGKFVRIRYIDTGF